MKHIQIENGLTIHLLQTRKFKTNVITVLLRTNLTREASTKNALLAGVLGQGCQGLESRLEIARECEQLYGAELDASIVKKGEEHIIQLYMEVLRDDICGASEETLLFERAGELLNGLLFKPLVTDGGFKPEYVAFEKERLRNVIAGRINDKKRYALDRCIEIMCEGERFGVSGDGYKEDIDGIDPQGLYSHYRRVLGESAIDIGIIGDIGVDGCEAWTKRHFARGRRRVAHCEPTAVLHSRGALREVCEKAGLNQGKLAIGARCDFAPRREEFYKFLLFCEIMGGGSSSKLFQSVREQSGLCYYINAFLFRAKAIMAVQAGIDENDYPEAMKIIRKQFDDAGNGSITDEELTLAKNAIINQMETRKDSPQGIMDFHMTNALLGDYTELSAMRGIIGGLTRKDVCDCAGRVAFDTSYFLT